MIKTMNDVTIDEKFISGMGSLDAILQHVEASIIDTQTINLMHPSPGSVLSKHWPDVVSYVAAMALKNRMIVYAPHSGDQQRISDITGQYLRPDSKGYMRPVA